MEKRQKPSSQSQKLADQAAEVSADQPIMEADSEDSSQDSDAEELNGREEALDRRPGNASSEGEILSCKLACQATRTRASVLHKGHSHG